MLPLTNCGSFKPLSASLVFGLALLMILAYTAFLSSGFRQKKDARAAVSVLGRSSSSHLVRVDAPMDYTWVLRTPDGKPVRTGDFRGKVLLINVWASWCPQCIAELDSVERLAESFKDQKNLALLIVSEEEPAAVRQFLLRHPSYGLPIYIAPQGRPPVLISPAYPVSFIVSKSGRVVASREGPAIWDAQETIRLLDVLLAESSLTPHPSALEELPYGDLPNKSPRLRYYPYYPPVVWRLKDKAIALAKQENYAQAERVIRKNLAVFEKNGASTVTAAEALAFLGMVVGKQGRLREAEDLQRRALGIAEKQMGSSWIGLLPYLDFLGKTYFSESKPAEAAKIHSRAITLAAGDPKQRAVLAELLRDLALDKSQMRDAASANALNRQADRVE